MATRKTLLFLVMGIVLMTAQLASAEVVLRFTPADGVIKAGETSRLSVFIDDVNANVRTIDITVTYDTTVVASLDGGAGAKYSDSGFFVFQGMENDVPGEWHGYAVVMGSTDYLEGPGELFYWDFSALADGVSPVIAVTAYVAAGDGEYYPDVSLEATTIIVGDSTSAAEDLPRPDFQLAVWPNPFNPRASLQVDLAESGPAHVAVYDLRGRQLTVMHNGQLPSGPSVFNWDGRDRHGRDQPSGQYLFRVKTKTGSRITRATLIR